MFHVAWFRPGRRGPFVSAKGPKTIDAPSGLIEEEGREHFEERTNSQGSHKARKMRRASLLGGQPAGVGSLGDEQFRDFQEKAWTVGMWSEEDRFRGFAPVRRGPFVSAKGPKTMLAVA